MTKRIKKINLNESHNKVNHATQLCNCNHDKQITSLANNWAPDRTTLLLQLNIRLHNKSYVISKA